MAQPLNPNNYSSINEEINTLLTSSAYSGITFTLYTDSNQTTIVTTESGPVQNETISQISQTNSYTNAENQIVPSTLTLYFNDGTSVTVTDGVENYWYVLSGTVFQPRTFGSA
jgi:mannose-6-phosphate isomerase-like protein (cupin superfamily)